MTNVPNLGAYGYVPSPTDTIAAAVAPASKDYLSIVLIVVAALLVSYFGYKLFKNMMQPIAVADNNSSNNNINQLPNIGNGNIYL